MLLEASQVVARLKVPACASWAAASGGVRRWAERELECTSMTRTDYRGEAGPGVNHAPGLSRRIREKSAQAKLYLSSSRMGMVPQVRESASLLSP